MFYKNFIRIRTAVPWRCRYFIADSKDHMAGHILENAKIPVRFGDDFQVWGGNYCIADCRFASRHEAKFISCMETLKAKMLVCGHADYNDFCAEFGEMFNNPDAILQAPGGRGKASDTLRTGSGHPL